MATIHRSIAPVVVAGMLAVFPSLATAAQNPSNANASLSSGTTREAEAPLAQPDYVVGPQDVLTITLWEQPDLSGKFTVEADGTFTFPLVGRLKGGGLTLRQVESELEDRLSQGYFTNPQLSVAIEEYRSQRIFVVGEVRTPGPYPLSREMTLIEALARAGSTTESAASHVVIVRPAAGRAVAGALVPGQADYSDADKSAKQPEIHRIDLNNLQSGALAGTVMLRDGDTVFVPKADTIFVFGQVRNPGVYPLAADTTVLQALSLAGGLTDRGSTRRIKVVRLINGKKQEVDVKLTDLVKPGDTIVISERFF
jgi:polysaccharide export outer membrane protein